MLTAKYTKYAKGGRNALNRGGRGTRGNKSKDREGTKDHSQRRPRAFATDAMLLSFYGDFRRKKVLGVLAGMVSELLVGPRTMPLVGRDDQTAGGARLVVC